MKKYQWGIIGLGNIAHEFAEHFDQETSELAAVASRTIDKAEAFAQRYHIPKAYGSYQEILNDQEIDIIYIAVPNRQHSQHIMEALAANKHVLCEKAITMNKKRTDRSNEISRRKESSVSRSDDDFQYAIVSTVTFFDRYKQAWGIKNDSSTIWQL